MNKIVKFSLLIVGLVLVGYGIYNLFAPESTLAINDMNLDNKDHNDAYITIVLGLVAVVLSAVGGKTYK